MNASMRITVEEVKKRMKSGEDFTIIDVRTPEVWAESDTMIPESIRVPLDELDKNLGRIPKTRPAVAYCTSPNEHSSARLAQRLRELGHENAWALQGGFQAWRTLVCRWSQNAR